MHWTRGNSSACCELLKDSFYLSPLSVISAVQGNMSWAMMQIDVTTKQKPDLLRQLWRFPSLVITDFCKFVIINSKQFSSSSSLSPIIFNNYGLSWISIKLNEYVSEVEIPSRCLKEKIGRTNVTAMIRIRN